VSGTSASPTLSLPAASPEWLRLARLAKLLAWVSLAWLCIEGTVGVIAGIVAGSVALVGFGLDSAIEGIASVIVVWRFSGSRTLSDTAEGRAQKLLGASFFLLAPYIAVEATRSLIGGAEAETSWVGIGLCVGTLFICQPLGFAKRRIGNKLGSSATSGEGTQNLLCGYLAGAVLVGLLGNTWFGLWWLDPVAALVIAAVAVGEGRKAWRGESCECAGCAVPTSPQSEVGLASRRSLVGTARP
jgi:divalent metal cation (Fe/Co/Zn/Cd) transporter